MRSVIALLFASLVCLSAPAVSAAPHRHRVAQQHPSHKASAKHGHRAHHRRHHGHAKRAGAPKKSR